MSSLGETQFVYTLSSRKRMVQHAIRSIQTLCRWITAEQITVFYTPPRNDEDRSSLQNLGVCLKEEPNETDAFSMSGDPPSHYGEKIKLCRIDADTVVFLDCDTIIAGDIREVIEGDFDFKARPGSAGVNSNSWPELFNEFERPLLPWMPNAGFIIFKNSTHKEIFEDWKHFLQTEIDYEQNGIKHKEQYALALAVSSYNCERMTQRDHVMEWAEERVADGIVYHMGTPKPTPPSSFKGNLYLALQSLRRGNI